MIQNGGCYLIDRIFRYNGVIVEELIKEDIVTAIQKYEPRIKVTNNDIYIIQQDEEVDIYLQYEIVETGEVNEYNMEITPSDNPYKS